MDKVALLAELRAMAEKVPDFKEYTPSSRPHLEWAGKAFALLSRWDQFEALSFRTAADYLTIDATRDVNVARMLFVLHRAIAELQIEVPALPAQAFGPGAVYDFHKALRDLLASATKSLFVVDPYLDDQVFDAYLSTVSQLVSVRLLARDYATSLKASVQKFVAQKEMTVEVRSSKAIHDRVVFVDDGSCWVLGQSIKDAAKTKPTYLAPLAPDAAQLKKTDYDQIWNAASPI